MMTLTTVKSKSSERMYQSKRIVTCRRGNVRVFFVAVVVSILLMVSTSGLQAEIQDYMTSSEFKSCGLDKLSNEELARLDVWLESYTLFVIEYFSREASSSTSDVIESRIDGTFEGWDGETVFKLVNGQIWQQSSYAYTYHYHYAYRPEVLIYKTNGRYKMKVEGVDKTIYVERIK